MDKILKAVTPLRPSHQCDLKIKYSFQLIYGRKRYMRKVDPCSP